MNAKIKKELRLLLPGTVCPLAVAAFAFRGYEFLESPLMPLWYFGMAILCILPFGREWACGTMSGLLAQPEPRNSLFLRKAGLLLVTVSTFTVLVGLCEYLGGKPQYDRYNVGVMTLMVPAIYGSGLWASIHLSSTWTAAGAAMALPPTVLLALMLLLKMLSWIVGEIDVDRMISPWEELYVGGAILIYCVILTALAWRKLRRLEV